MWRTTAQPSELSPTFSWKFTTPGGTSILGETTTNAWGGTMVFGGTIEVKATVSEQELTQTMSVIVNDRGWETSIPFNTDTTAWGGPNPTEAKQLGRAVTSFATTGLETAAVLSGPNDGFKYTVALNVSAPVTVRMNKHFYMTNPPQSWIDFKNAQGNEPNEAQYTDIEPAVKKHEGFLGPADLSTDSHYKHWHVSVVRKGTTEDPRAQIERLVMPLSTNLAEYHDYVRNWLNWDWNNWAVDEMEYEPSS